MTKLPSGWTSRTRAASERIWVADSAATVGDKWILRAGAEGSLTRIQEKTSEDSGANKSLIVIRMMQRLPVGTQEILMA